MRINSELLSACFDASALRELLINWKVPYGVTYETKRELEVCKARMYLLLEKMELEGVNQSPELNQNEKDLILVGERVTAVMRYRERIGCDLLTAKAKVDQYQPR